MAGDAFQKFKSSLNRGITTISVKTSSSLEKTKIKTHIDSINREIQRNFSNVGENAYNIWLNGSDDFSALNETFEEIKSKYKEIDELKEQLVYIDQRDNEILGTAVKETPIVQQTPEEETVEEETVEAEETVVEEAEPEVETKEEPKVEPKSEQNQEEPKTEEPKAEQPKKRFCRNCGTGYEVPVKFCRKCGTKMSE